MLRQRYQLPQHALASLFGTVTATISRAENQIRPLLTQAGHVIEPAPATFKTLPELTAYASAHGIDLLPPKAKPAC